MADTVTSTRQDSPRRTRGRRWMNERQLDAYLQAREALRRVRATVASTQARQSAPPPPPAT